MSYMGGRTREERFSITSSRMADAVGYLMWGLTRLFMRGTGKSSRGWCGGQWESPKSINGSSTPGRSSISWLDSCSGLHFDRTSTYRRPDRAETIVHPRLAFLHSRILQPESLGLPFALAILPEFTTLMMEILVLLRRPRVSSL